MTVTATDSARIDALTVSLSGALGGALGGAVIASTITTSTQAFVSGSSSAKKTRINKADQLAVLAQSTQVVNALSFGVSLGSVAAGESKADSTVSGITRAYVGDFAEVGKASGLSVASLQIDAVSDVTATSKAYGISAGIGGATVNLAKAVVNPVIQAFVGDSDVKVTGGAVVTAQSKQSATAKTFGVTVGAGIGVGASVSEARIAPDMDAFIGTGADVTAGTITIQSLHNFDSIGNEIARGALAQADASGGGLLSGNGTDAKAFSTANVETYVGAGAALHATGEVKVLARAHNLAVADANALSIGAGALGTSLSSATAGGITKAYLQDRDASGTGRVRERGRSHRPGPGL